MRLIAAVLALALVASSASCTRSHEDDGNLLIYHGYKADDVKTWDPANAYDSVSLDLLPNVVETLYQYEYLTESYRLIPLLAESMPKFSKDRLTVTIPIRKGVRFQDDPCFKATGGKGRELKAQDFVYNMKRLALPSIHSEGFWIFDGRLVGFNAFKEKLDAGGGDQPIEGLQALDDYTLQFKLTKPYPQLPYILAMTFTSPFPREAVEAYADKQGNVLDHPVGTGPFVLKSWDRNKRVVLEKNPNFRGELYPKDGEAGFRKLGHLADAGKPMPFVDRLSFEIIKEHNPRWLNFMSGKLDAVEIPKDNLGSAITNKVNLSPELTAKGIRLEIETGLVIRYVSFNMLDPVIGGADKKLLRQALSSAIDREAWIQTFTNGTAKKMVTLLPPGIADRDEKAKLKYDFNLARAKELLAKAGYPGGNGLPRLKFDLRGADSSQRQLGEFISKQWAAIGVQVDVVSNTFPAFLEKRKQGNLQAFYGGWQMDYPDGENVLQVFYGPSKAPGPNDQNYQNPEVDKLYVQVSTMDPGPKRAALVKKIDDLVQEDVPIAMAYYETAYFLSHPWVHNYRGNDLIQNKYKYFRIDPELKKRYSDSK